MKGTEGGQDSAHRIWAGRYVGVDGILWRNEVDLSAVIGDGRLCYIHEIDVGIEQDCD